MPRTNDLEHNCVCGGKYLSSNKWKHEKTKQHLNFILKTVSNTDQPLYVNESSEKPVYVVIDGLEYGELIHKDSVFCNHCNKLTEQYYECPTNSSYCPTCHYFNFREINNTGIFSKIPCPIHLEQWNLATS
jgi:hypothetical protein